MAEGIAKDLLKYHKEPPEDPEKAITLASRYK